MKSPSLKTKRKMLVTAIAVAALLVATVVSFAIATDVYSAPTSRIERTVIPETDSTYDLGSASVFWRDGYFDGIVLSPFDQLNASSSRPHRLETGFKVASTTDPFTLWELLSGQDARIRANDAGTLYTPITITPSDSVDSERQVDFSGNQSVRIPTNVRGPTGGGFLFQSDSGISSQMFFDGNATVVSLTQFKSGVLGSLTFLHTTSGISGSVAANFDLALLTQGTGELSLSSQDAELNIAARDTYIDINDTNSAGDVGLRLNNDKNDLWLEAYDEATGLKSANVIFGIDPGANSNAGWVTIGKSPTSTTPTAGESFHVAGGQYNTGDATTTGTATFQDMVDVSKNSTTTCSTAIEGHIFYNDNNNRFWGCDGSIWNRLNG